MTALFASGHAVDIVLAVLMLEAAFLLARRRDAAAVVLALLPGGLMMLALRAALTGAAWPWIALPLAASFPVHLLDVRRRGL